MLNIEEKVIKLTNYSKELTGFQIAEELDSYTNMGAIIIDASLQAGIRYKTTVKPRIAAFMADYSDLTTTSEFYSLTEKFSTSTLINWKDDSKKVNLIDNLTQFLVDENVETHEDFFGWLEKPENTDRMKKISGIGDKTVDYLKILTGHKTNAIDRHLLKFMKDAGVATDGYSEANEVISLTAKSLGVDEALYDHSIWLYMSNS